MIVDMEQVAKRKRGRPRRDYSGEVGAVYGINGAVVLEVVSAAEGPKARFKCGLCGGIGETELRKLKDGHTTSCACRKRNNYRMYHRRMIDAMQGDPCRVAWSAHYSGSTREAIAKANSWPLAAVDEMIRLYERTLADWVKSGQADDVYRDTLKLGTNAASKKWNISREAIIYCIRAVRGGHFRYNMPEIPLTDDVAADDARVAAAIEEAGNMFAVALVDHVRFAGEEFNQSQLLRRRNGKLSGTLADVYVAAITLRDADDSTAFQRQGAQTFIAFADQTLANRRERQIEGAKRAIAEQDAADLDRWFPPVKNPATISIYDA